MKKKSNQYSFIMFASILISFMFFLRSYGVYFVEPLGRISTPIPKTNAYKYVVDGGGSGSVKMCAVASETGALSGCVPTAFNFSNPVGITINNTTGQNLAYIPGATTDNKIAVCRVSVSTGVLTGCVTTIGSTVRAPIDITIFGGFAYIANFFNAGTQSVAKCQLDTTSGLFTSCSSFSSTGTIINPGSITNYNGFIYVVYSGGVRVCTPAGSCQSAGGYAFGSPVSISTNNGFSYVADSATNTIIKCSISSADGTFSNCAALAPSGPSFNFGCCGFSGVTVGNNYAYVSNANVNSLFVCTVNSDGTFGICKVTGSGSMNSPKHIY